MAKNYNTAFPMGQDRSKISLLIDTRLTKNITILPELEALIRPLREEEFMQLEANIVEQGCRDSLLIWKTEKGIIDHSSDATPVNILVDGHNRYKICLKNNIDFDVSLGTFSTLDQVKDWMILNQLGRRNITPEEQSYLRGKLYNTRKEQKGRYDRMAADQIAELPADNKAKKKNTALDLAEQFQVGERTIRNDGDFAAGLDKLANTLKNEVLGRKTKVSKADIIKLADLPEIEKSITTTEELQTYLSMEKGTPSLPQQPNNPTTLLTTPSPNELIPDNTAEKQPKSSKRYAKQVKTISEQIQRLQNRDLLNKDTCEELLLVVDDLRKRLTNLKAVLP